MLTSVAKRLQGGVAFCLVITILSFFPIAICASSNSTLPPAGQVTVAGKVSIDEIPAISGQTVFSGSTINTGAGSYSILALNNLCRIELSEETTLKISFSDSVVAAALDAGRVRVTAPQGTGIKLTTPGITLLADSSQLVLFDVRVERGSLTVSVEEGELKAISGEDTQLIMPGKVFSTMNAPPQQAGTPQNLSGGAKAGILLGIGGAITLLAIILTGGTDNEVPREPCNQPVILSDIVINPCR